MVYAFNPKTLRIRTAEKASKLGKAKSIKIFHSDEEFHRFLNEFMDKQEREINEHTQALKVIQGRIDKIRAQLTDITRRSDA